ncbi:MAG: dihydroorotase [Thermodesulfobacteriaceae bacterium]|nr:dihydroorotase [Thermodesulfobacteriaceae bacterium]MCX8042105.1 dihydroorotase [Thermodesulfobacteriaceae bacterium]MDW8136493.1 dihydroorotase [Thermodesulfobacterium sp.]
MKILIKRGRLIDPSQNLDIVGDLLIEEGRIVGWERNIEISEKVELIWAEGLWILPGLVDIHVHLRDPGEEWKEDITSGTLAALYGGVLRVACMPNTKPPNDTPEVTNYIIKKAQEKGWVKVLPIACITKNQEGKELTEFGRLKRSGAVALSDDGRWVQNSELMKRALHYAKNFDLPVISHCEDHSLTEGGQVNQGKMSAKLGLKEIPAMAEVIGVIRDLLLAKDTNYPVHLAHISSKEVLPFLRWAKEEGIPFTAETCPHYFTLTEKEVENYNTLAKVNPPLRGEEDVYAIKQALKEGIIEVISSDHAPHSELEKKVEFEWASFGMLGLQTLFPLSLNLVREEILSPLKLAEYLILNPSKILKIEPPSFKSNVLAEVILVSPYEKYILTEDLIKSKSKNTPFLNQELQGRVKKVILKDKIYDL